jgi:hypothetical protein
MAVPGQKRRFDCALTTSAFPRTTDIARHHHRVRLVPRGDMTVHRQARDRERTARATTYSASSSCASVICGAVISFPTSSRSPFAC